VVSFNTIIDCADEIGKYKFEFPTKVWILSFSFSNKANPKRSTVNVSLGNLLAKVSGPVESLFLMEPAYIQTNSARRILPGLTSPGTYFSIINKKSESIIYQIWNTKYSMWHSYEIGKHSAKILLNKQNIRTKCAMRILHP